MNEKKTSWTNMDAHPKYISEKIKHVTIKYVD